MAWWNFLGGLLKPVADIVDDLTLSKEEKEEMKLKFTALLQDYDKELVKQRGSIITAEAKSEHWLTANWRPMLMTIFGLIVANNYIIYPYLQWMFGDGVMLELPPQMWDLLKIGVGGYIVGRSAEKGIKAFKK